jgi:A/G-specific adenine glycosylase
MQKIIIRRLLKWYEKNRRDLPWRNTRDIYSIWISEIMLQQTQVATVIPFYTRFMETFPSLSDLIRAGEEDILKIWQGLGYYSRVHNLMRAIKLIQQKYNATIPENPVEFRELPGVGDYIAAAVLSIARGIPLAAVDGNVLRVSCRFYALPMDIRNPKTRIRITKYLQKIIPARNPGDFNQAMMELGSGVCRSKKTLCRSCPISVQCQAFQSDRVADFPKKSSKKKIPEYNVSLAVIVNHKRFFIQKRPSKGHLGGMWEFPGGKAGDHESPEETLLRECQEELKVKPIILEKMAFIKHAYTHFKVNLSFFLCEIPDGQVIESRQPYCWINLQQIKDFPFPRANHKFFPVLESYFSLYSPGT